MSYLVLGSCSVLLCQEDKNTTEKFSQWIKLWEDNSRNMYVVMLCVVFGGIFLS